MTIKDKKARENGFFFFLISDHRTQGMGETFLSRGFYTLGTHTLVTVNTYIQEKNYTNYST